MATAGTEKHTRLTIAVMKGGTNITRRLLETRVLELIPTDRPRAQWTVDEFLLLNKATVLSKHIGKKNENKYFPGASAKTNLDHWDLGMFCYVLAETCELDEVTKMHVDEIRQLRNKLSHLNEPSLGGVKYDNYMRKIEVIYERILTRIGDDTFEEEMKEILKAAKGGELSVTDTVRWTHRLYQGEEETREQLSQHTKDHEQMLRKLDTLLERIGDSGIGLQLPETKVVIAVKDCIGDPKRHLSKLLKDLIDSNIDHTKLPDELSDESHRKLREAVDQAVETFLLDGWQITSTENKCVLLRIRCASLKNLVKLFQDCISGKLNQHVKPLQAAVKEKPEFEEVTLEVIIYEDEFWRVMEKAVSTVDKYISSLQRSTRTAIDEETPCGTTINQTGVTFEARLHEKLLTPGAESGENFNRWRNNIRENQQTVDAGTLTTFMEDYKTRILTTFNDEGVIGFYNLVTEIKGQWKQIPLNVAIVGNSGVGKSSLINTFLMTLADDNIGADADALHCTEKPTPYRHPYCQNLVLWDLPGVGTPEHPRESYLERVGFERYDCFVITSASRFTENDLWLARAIKHKHPHAETPLFYFVRTKVDSDLHNYRKSHRFHRSDDYVLSQIRKEIQQSVWNEGFPDTPIFLIENYEQHKYDFSAFSIQLISESPDLKRKEMAISLQVLMENLIDKKKEVLTQRMMTVCLTSASAGSVPLPGFSIAVDAALLVKEANYYRKQLGLNKEDLSRVACLLQIPLDVLQKTLKLESTGYAITIRGLSTLLAGTSFFVANTAKVAIALPIIGSFIGAGASFYSTRYVLTSLLDLMVTDAKKLIKRICEMLDDDRF